MPDHAHPEERFCLSGGNGDAAMNDDKTAKEAGLTPGTKGAGESGGGSYPNPHKGKKPKDGFMGHGGQTEIDEKLSPGEPK